MKFLIDLHTHTSFSHDAEQTPADMAGYAQKMGLTFYGISDHFDYDCDFSHLAQEERAKFKNGDEDEYFHNIRHVQDDYAGVLNVLVGAEFGYSNDADVQGRYALTYEKYRPDYVINSVHCFHGQDYAYTKINQEKPEMYQAYLQLIRDSLDAPYHYDIVGHIGYAARYAPFEDKDFDLEHFGAQIDDILKTIIQKDKILEVNTANKTLPNRTLPADYIIERYYQLGGRNICFGSDAHYQERILDKWDEVVALVKRIGFTHWTVPCRGEYIKVEL
jgi:histidinol-phosphatase (PHP family)